MTVMDSDGAPRESSAGLAVDQPSGDDSVLLVSPQVPWRVRLLLWLLTVPGTVDGLRGLGFVERPPSRFQRYLLAGSLLLAWIGVCAAAGWVLHLPRVVVRVAIAGGVFLMGNRLLFGRRAVPGRERPSLVMRTVQRWDSMIITKQQIATIADQSTVLAGQAARLARLMGAAEFRLGSVPRVRRRRGQRGAAERDLYLAGAMISIVARFADTAEDRVVMDHVAEISAVLDRVEALQHRMRRTAGVHGAAAAA